LIHRLTDAPSSAGGSVISSRLSGMRDSVGHKGTCPAADTEIRFEHGDLSHFVPDFFGCLDLKRETVDIFILSFRHGTFDTVRSNLVEDSVSQSQIQGGRNRLNIQGRKLQREEIE